MNLMGKYKTKLFKWIYKQWKLTEIKPEPGPCGFGGEMKRNGKEEKRTQ